MGIFSAIYEHPYTGKTSHQYTTACSQLHVNHLAKHCLESSPCKTQHTQRYGDIRRYWARAIYEHTCHATKTPPIHHIHTLAPHHSSHTSTSPPPLTTPERFPNAPLHPDGSLRCRASLTGGPQLGESRTSSATLGSGCCSSSCEGEREGRSERGEGWRRVNTSLHSIHRHTSAHTQGRRCRHSCMYMYHK